MKNSKICWNQKGDIMSLTDIIIGSGLIFFGGKILDNQYPLYPNKNILVGGSMILLGFKT